MPSRVFVQAHQGSFFAGGMEAVCSSCGVSSGLTLPDGPTLRRIRNIERYLTCDDVV
jgi:hypothetical protein